MLGSDKRDPYAQRVNWPQPGEPGGGAESANDSGRMEMETVDLYTAAIAEEERAAALAEEAYAAGIAARASERHRRIAAAAYRIAQRNGFSSETALDDWLAAEREVRAQEGEEGVAAPDPAGPQDH